MVSRDLLYEASSLEIQLQKQEVLFEDAMLKDIQLGEVKKIYRIIKSVRQRLLQIYQPKNEFPLTFNYEFAIVPSYTWPPKK
jgi:hypothetical protein